MAVAVHRQIRQLLVVSQRLIPKVQTSRRRFAVHPQGGRCPCMCWSCWFHRCRSWRRQLATHCKGGRFPCCAGRVGSTGAGCGKDNRHSTVCRSWRISLKYSLLPLSSTKLVVYATPVTTLTAAPIVFQTVTVPIATRMVHGTKTFEILGTAPVHQETPAETVEGFEIGEPLPCHPCSSRHPSWIVEYGEPALRCGVRGARTPWLRTHMLLPLSRLQRPQ